MSLSRSAARLALAIVTVMIALLAGASAAMGIEGGQARMVDPDPILLPFLTNRHDPTLNAPVFGVQMYGRTGPASNYYPFLVDSGATWVRAPISWASIEPTEAVTATYDWASADIALEAAKTDSGAFSVVATISDNPHWAAAYQNGPINLDDLDSFAAFVEAAVERYDGDGFQDAPDSPIVNHWELYNEPDALVGPNLEPHWGGEGSQYAHMLSIAYPAVKSANSAAKVVFGGLAYDWFVDQNGHFDRQFIDDVLNAGGGDYFDFMNFHVYPIFWYNWTDHKSPGLLEKAAFLKDKLASYGYPDKPFVITESGWHSNQPGDPESPTASNPEDQARFVVELFTQNMAAGSELMIWWMLYDPGGTYQYENGLVTNETQPHIKPSFVAFQVIDSELRSAHFQRVLPLNETGAPDMEAYEFKDNVHQRSVYVAWLDPVDSTEVKPLLIPASLVTVRDIYGSSYPLSDGQDGQVDGYVTVNVSGQPVYVEVDW